MKIAKTVSLGLIGLLGLTALAPVPQARGDEFSSDWPEGTTRTWIGPAFWANRLQDWRIADGRLECLNDAPGDPYRTVHLLTHQIGPGDADFEMSVRVGAIGEGDIARDAAVGFLVGDGGEGMDYRAAAMVHRNPGPGGGMFAGIDGQGRLFLRSFARPQADQPAFDVRVKGEGLSGELILRLRIGRTDDGKPSVGLFAEDPANMCANSCGMTITLESGQLPSPVTGNVALVSHPGTGPNAARFWFRDWTVSGPRVEAHPDHAFGPILATLYTVQNGVLKLNAQMAPVGETGPQTVELQVQNGDGWKAIATTKIVVPGWTAPFRVEGWDATKDVPFRVVYSLDPDRTPYLRTGTIRRDPKEKATIVLAALSCNENFGGGPRGGGTYAWSKRSWFPHNDLTPNLARHDPDLFFFAGDQVYQGDPTPPVLEPLDEAILDYLYKWYLWCWAFGDVVRDTPCICIPDDHDVYQGNFWGMGGEAAQPGDPNGLKGGFGMPPEWLNMMQRTQTSHLPDPYDPTPIKQGITVYYTGLTVGGIGFAILEDRMFKSSPAIVDAPMTIDSHIIDPEYDISRADVAGATLLGDRQLSFLRDFAGDWRGQEMKAALSQTIFANLQISSRPPTTGELDRDLDSNGWPQTGRKKALREMRRGFMIHIAGDQHLGSVIHQGIDAFQDANWSFCVPATANLYPRFWNPDYPPLAPHPVRGPFTGPYEDGFGNLLTVYAVANPTVDPPPGRFPEPVELHREGTGYGIIRFDKQARTSTLELWPRYVDPTDPATGSQYPGWPIVVRQMDNDGRTAVALLPKIRVEGMDNPVVQVIDEADGEVVHTLRVHGAEYQPRVYREGTYTLKVGEPGTDRMKTLEGVRSLELGEKAEIAVEFE